ncbi:MAG: hypothetical protein ACTSYY_01660 [Promethearchaeota archaeon]
MRNITKKTYMIYILASLFLYFIITLISINLYPNSYSLFNHISNLGSKFKNPKGYLIWNIGTVVFGLFSIHHILYIHKYLIRTSPRLGLLNCILGIISSIGLSLVGIFREDYILAHFIVASVAFIGLLITFNLDLIILIRLKSKFGQKRSYKVVFFMYIPLNLIFFISIILPNLDFFFPLFVSNSQWLTYPPWEWLYFIILLLFILIFSFIIPEN